MVGMNQIKKRLLYGILIGLAVGVIGIIVTIIITNNTIKTYEEGTNKDFIENFTGTVVTFNRDVIQGETITADMISMARVHNTTIPLNAATQGGVIGKIAKYNIPKNVTVVSNMVSDKIVSQDVRTQQITAVLLPAKLTVGEYVDIRLQVPSGVEYIVLPQKQILDISGTTIWMDLSEDELLLLNSAIVDSYMTDGSKLYAVEYADPDTQISTDDAAAEMARKEIEDKIAAEITNITGQPLTTTTNETTNGTTNETTIQSTTTTTTTTAEDGETTTQIETQIPVTTIPATQLVDLITTYAIEYRYYVESYNKIESTYQPNSTVMAAMQTNKYVVEQAKERLSAEARLAMEASITSFENTYSDDYSSIVSGIDSSISTQQTLRNQVIQGY